jgi:hypothetical protein
VKPRAANSKLKQGFNTDVTVIRSTKLNGLKSRDEALEFVVAWYMETWAEMDIERGFSFEGPFSEGRNLDEICEVYADHLVEEGHSFPLL